MITIAPGQAFSLSATWSSVCSAAGVNADPLLGKVIGPDALISDRRWSQALPGPRTGAGPGGALAVTGPPIPIVSTIFRFGQAASAACSIASCWPPEPVVPIRVRVSPLMARPKSETDAAALKTPAALEKSSDVISRLSRTLSTMLISGPKPLFSAASSDSFASTVGMSPESLMSLPLRVIDTGASITAGIVGVPGAPPDGLGTFSVGNAPVGPLNFGPVRLASP